MNKIIVLAVDAARHEPGQHVSAAVEMVRNLAADTGDQVIVLHVHEFAVGRFGRLQVDCAEQEGEKLVSEIVADLRSSGLKAEGEIIEANLGNIARAILKSADHHDARLVALGSRSRTDLPWVPLGSVSSRLLHLATRPAMIVPMHPAQHVPAGPQGPATAG